MRDTERGARKISILNVVYNDHSFKASSLLFNHAINSSLFTSSPFSVDATLTFFPSTNSHFCSFTVTSPSFSSDSPRMTANGTSSFSPAANCVGSFGLLFAKKSAYHIGISTIVSMSNTEHKHTFNPACLSSCTNRIRSVNSPSPAAITNTSVSLFLIPFSTHF